MDTSTVVEDGAQRAIHVANISITVGKEVVDTLSVGQYSKQN